MGNSLLVRYSPLLTVVLLLTGFPVYAKAAATTTTLTVSSGGTQVTSVAPGSVVVLTATVTSGGSPVTAGQVDFCDATAPHCTDVHVLGAAQLTKGGTATFRFRPKAGSNRYQAVFVGTTNAAASASAVADLTVTGKNVTSTLLTQSGAPGNYTLTAEVGGPAATAPAGNLTFLDATNSNTTLGTAKLGSGTSSLTFFNSFNLSNPAASPFPPSSSAPIQIAVADYNGDGISDLAVLDEDGTVTIWLGNPDGSFAASPTVPHSQDNNSIAITAGDFNRDGNADLAIVNSGNSTITVLLGNGDGTFMTTPATSMTVPVCGGFCPMALVAADFNRDGILDLVTSTGMVLLGTGDGKFAAAPNLQGALPAGIGTSIALGDFDGDGNLDLAMSNGALYLGNGDGTFRAGTTLSATGPIVAGDFNGDGKLDLAVANTPASQGFTVIPTAMVTILLGKGDGTFSVNATGPSTSNVPAVIAVGDFNGDGIPDLAVTNYVDLLMSSGGTPDPIQTSILLGNGKGNFTLATSTASETTMNADTGLVESLAVADFNGDGIVDLAQPFWDGSFSEVGVVNVFLSEQSTALASVTRIAVPTATGTHNVVAQYAGDTNNLPSTSAATSLQSLQGASMLTMTLSPNPAPYGTSVAFSATAAGVGSTPTGSVSFYNGNALLLGTATLNGSGIATFATSALILGTYSITATYGGDPNYTASSSSASTLTITKGIPTATLATSASPVLVSAPVTFTLTLTGGAIAPTGTVTFMDGTTTLGTATLSSGSAALTTSTLALGSHSITASYSGDSYYNPATSAAVTVLVASTLTPVFTAPTPTPVSPGSSATTTLTIAAGPTYSGTMNLTCALTSSPAGAQSLPTCTLNPTSLKLIAGGTGTSVFAAKTTAATTSAALLPLRWKFRGGAVLAGLLLLGIARRRRQTFATLALLLIFVAAMATGCGGGSSSSGSGSTGTSTPGTTAGTYAFTVTGTDSANPSTTITTKVAVTVE